MKTKLIIPCLFVLLLSCAKNGQPLGTELVRAQTQCADPWPRADSNEETIALLKAYLTKRNIATNEITLQATGQQVVCLACNCSTGYVYHVFADPPYTDSLKTLGFTVK